MSSLSKLISIIFLVSWPLKALKMPGTKDEPEDESGSDSDSGKSRKDRDRDRKSKRPMTEFEKKRQKIEETKKSLPVFPFREQLLQAIEGHQVSTLACLQALEPM